MCKDQQLYKDSVKSGMKLNILSELE